MCEIYSGHRPAPSLYSGVFGENFQQYSQIDSMMGIALNAAKVEKEWNDTEPINFSRDAEKIGSIFVEIQKSKRIRERENKHASRTRALQYS